MALKRAAVAGVTALMTANIWTGCPLLALWIGSHASGSSTLSMAAVGVVLVVLVVLEFVMVVALAWLISAYDELIGRPPAEPRATWLRSLCAPDADGHISKKRAGISSLDGIVVINVYVAVITLAVWYVFFAPHPSSILCPIHC
jgi:hypothetical protein